MLRLLASKRSLLSQGIKILPRFYHEKVIDHFNNPRNVGSFDKNDPAVGTGLVGAPACGDVMKLQIKVDDTTGEILDACFKTFGCGSAIASSSVATEWVKGKQMEEVLTIKNTEIAKHLSLPPVKLHCSMLAEDAIKAAVKDYQTKRAKLSGDSETEPVEQAAKSVHLISKLADGIDRLDIVPHSSSALQQSALVVHHWF
ncbi:IRON-SULFUR CLUSTER ASSEMBLY ENZYME NIFU-like protein [Salix viminalis]|uniref:Iron-sulfur cluster assembly protein n=1 Tax=Salix viminalis TaxID=40686 RepID=A0A9Q0SGZ0_SALVM|nr:IRON-SULFUR CLUSTER ASSEMBLY ENZYME NIFU-like protein [Salix viminalis]